ncbi:MAG: LemA family protein [Candidatus Hydrogenedentes bacterium]|nr:LemA family protein [Candidatus Hydrogenedentota bacterium]
MLLVIIAGVIVLVALFWVIGLYNQLVRLRNAVRNAWSQIDVQLKRRHDLIPNLVETVRGYMTHERETLEAVTRARNLAQGASQSGVTDRAQAEGQLSRALMNLFAVAEQYPDLKANQNFMALQEELVSTENRISFARQAYNDAVMTLNNAIQMFPANMVAGMFGFNAEPFFEVDSPEERQAPKVSFSR